MASFIILTQYYPPETGAPQNRLHSFAKYLKKAGHDVSVITALPNYPKNEIFQNYKGRYSIYETIDSIPIYHIWLYVSPSRGVVARLLNYFSFMFTSFFSLLRLPKANYLICESPPLFLGITAVLISWIKGTRLVFNVSDLWPESAEKLNIISNRLLIKLAYGLEKWIYYSAYLISGQTKGIVNSITTRFPSRNVIWFPNGVDVDFFEDSHESYNWRNEMAIAADDFVLLYAGIIGHAQGLEVILRAAEGLKELPIKFLIVGDGPEKEMLMIQAKAKQLWNVIFQENIQKSKMPSLIKTCDAYIVPLKKLDLFRGAIPSKLFEPLALAKPILLGVDGEARELFIDEGKAGLYFEPENGEELAKQIGVLFNDRVLAATLGAQGQQYVKENFDRQQIHSKLLSHFSSPEERTRDKKMNQKYKLQIATYQDLPRIAQCHRAAFPNALSTAMGQKYVEKMLEWYLVDERAFIFALEENNQIVGYCGGLKFDGTARVGSASSMIQHSYNLAVKTFLKKPWLFLHPEFFHKYRLAARNVLRRIKKIFYIEDKVAQTVSKLPDPHTGLIVIGVHPNVLGKGYGSLLLQEFERISINLGFHKMMLTVRTDNRQAIKSYLRNRWVSTRVEGYSTTMERFLK